MKKAFGFGKSVKKSALVSTNPVSGKSGLTLTICTPSNKYLEGLFLHL